MPETFPSCFGDYGSHDLDSSGGGRTAQNLVTCLYQTKFAGFCRLVSITWCKSLMGQGLNVSVDDPNFPITCKVDMKPWFFWKRQGSKSFDMGDLKVEIFWDLSSAKYVCGPEPHEGFYVAIVHDREIFLLLGDLHKEAMKKTRAAPAAIEATLLSRREHVFGKKFYTTKSQFGDNGRTHDIAIECHTGGVKEPRLCVTVDKQLVVQVKRLMWKFRGNQTILVDGIPVEVFWDVHNWLFNPGDGHDSHAVFMFKTCLSNEKPWLSEPGVPLSVLQWPASHSFKDTGKKNWFTDSSCASVLQWPSTCSFKEKDFFQDTVGFSLLLYAWKNE